MKRLLTPAFLFLCLALAQKALAESQIEVEQAWSRATMSAATNGIIYLTIVNLGDEMDRLIGADTPAAEHASVHEIVERDGMTGMQPVSGLAIGPGEQKIFGPLAPGGLHIMMENLTATINEGDTFPLTLTFEKAGGVRVRVTAGTLMAMEPPKELREPER